jgi:hypothetical protein
LVLNFAQFLFAEEQAEIILMKINKNGHNCAVKSGKRHQMDNIDILVGLRLSFIIRTLLIGGQYWLICAEYRYYRTVHEKNVQHNKYSRRKLIMLFC